MSKKVQNIQEFLVDRVIHYLKQQDVRFKKLTEKIEICAKCDAPIKIRSTGIRFHKEGKYRRCCCALPEDGGCRFIICDSCDETYPWHENNSWFGVHPRPLEYVDFMCPKCSG